MSTQKILFYLLVVGLIAGVNGFSVKSSLMARHRQQPEAPIRQLYMAEDDSFWTQQRDLMENLLEKNERSERKEQQGKFAKRQSGLVNDTVFFTTLIFSGLWLLFDDPFFPFSYAFGSVFGIFYAYGLGKYVETIGGSFEDAGAVQGAGVGQARFAFLILLIVCVGKLQSSGLIPISAILGFFTYQIASLTQGLREFDD
jgi:hypothetical protein